MLAAVAEVAVAVACTTFTWCQVIPIHVGGRMLEAEHCSINSVPFDHQYHRLRRVILIIIIIILHLVSIHQLLLGQLLVQVQVQLLLLEGRFQ
jgi:hypothetical protein